MMCRGFQSHPDEQSATSSHVSQQPLSIPQSEEVCTKAVDDVPGLAVDPVLGNRTSEPGTP
eukprot:CAMPEP_0203938642 /NCGR_PEP_ID=MMETSP0359-20131031/75618_1 /ASSEMBLY_ACC=CAM_ASM_000338 /TAXON_ID=268821 /ORGANISM="Scrippsiella Hangoei, Strain SHTV-5" /LENGTH=60 /DNA_ID=CAMNT_0050868867 /DNA_START=158 /DNA_END=340 /DNA_ORIENTATION=-